MLEGLKFNQDIYKYRMENPTQLLLYNVKDGQIFLAQGNTKDFLLNIINKKITTLSRARRVHFTLY